MCISKKIQKFIDFKIIGEKQPFNATIIIIKGKIQCYAISCPLGRPSNYISRKVRTDKNIITRHSEIQALQLIRKNMLKKRKNNAVTIINFRSTVTGIKNSCCCIPCMETLSRLGIQRIVYSTDDGTFVKTNVEKLKEIAIYSRGSRQLINLSKK